MPARRILQLGDPMLRQVSSAVPCPSDARLLLRDLCATLGEFRRTHGFGRGISAVQIGELQRVIYIEFESVPYSLINPVYERMSEEKFRLWDDCFSFPGLVAWVERSVSVAVSYREPSGETRTIEASGKLSELLQHEMDHLDGILALDRAIGPNGLATREEYERRRSR
jgi:peptide deformylase